MHEAFESIEVIKGLKDKPESILVHANKLFIGDNHGSLSIHRLSSGGDGVTSSSSLIETRSDFNKNKKSIELLGIIKESNTLVSLSDSIVSLHDLSTLSPSGQLTPSSSSSSATLPQTKSALTFSIDTSVQRRPLPPKPPSRFIHRDTNFNPNDSSSSISPSPSTLGRNSGSSLAYRPSGTLPRQRNPINASGSDPSWRQSLRGMDDLVREKEERELRVKEGLQNVSRDGLEVGNGGEGIMTLVTVLAVGCRRKVVLFRWVDGEFWDSKEISLPHSPRSLAFPTPTSLFLGYSSTDYSILSIPLASSSSVFSSTPQLSASQSSNLLGTGTLIPLNSSNGPRVDTNSDLWKVKELTLPSQQSTSSSEQDSSDQTKNQDQAQSGGGGLGAAFGGLGGYIGLGPKTNKNSKSILSIETGETLFTKEGQTSSFFLNEFGKPSRREGIEWNGSIPEDLSYAKPYLVSILPAGTPYDAQEDESNNDKDSMTRSKSLHPTSGNKVTSLSSNLPSSNSFASWGNPLASSSNDHQGGPDLRSLIQVRSSSTLAPVQTFPFPPKETSTNESHAYQLHHLTSSPGSKPPFFLISTPIDRNLLEKNGSSIWKFEMKSWNSQIEELISKKEWTEALRLIEGIDERMLGLGIGKKMEKTKELRLLHGLELFKMEKFEEAIDVFTELELNPAKVLTLFPKEISGDLSRERKDWEEVVGGRKRKKEDLVEIDEDKDLDLKEKEKIIEEESSVDKRDESEITTNPSAISNETQDSNTISSIPIPTSNTSTSSPSSTPIPSPSSQVQPQPRQRERSRFTSLLSGGLRPSSMIFGDHVQIKDKETDTGSIRSLKSIVTKEKSEHSNLKSNPSSESANEATSKKALDALGRFLADRRRIFMPLLESLDQDGDLNQELEKSTLTVNRSNVEKGTDEMEKEIEYLFSIPSIPLNELNHKDLKEIAIVVDTALFKTFLKTKPGLIGSLCRVRNWCKVEEVEGVLEERKKFSELISLYSSKHQHGKALALLRKFANEEDDPEEKLDPTIRYLQNLDERFIEVILENAHWVLREDPKKGMEIFTADTGRVADFPRLYIVSDLEKFDSDLCVEYLEHIISALGEGEPELHEKLIFGYLKQIANLQALENGNVKEDDESKSQLESRMRILKKMHGFLESSQQYDAEKILGHMPSGSNANVKTNRSQSRSRSQKTIPKEEEAELSEESTILYQARATLLGRMGQHEGALGIYVHRLKDHYRAEDYCKRVWNENLRRERDQSHFNRDEFGTEMNRNPSTTSSSARNNSSQKDIDPRKEDRNVFLTLLRIYLRPSSNINTITSSNQSAKSNSEENSSSDPSQYLQLEPAISLISRHSARLDTSSVLSLLPPLVKLKDIQSFTTRALQQSTANRNEFRVLREISQARDLQVEEKRISRLRKRIRVEENRTCPRCSKRLGNSVIAVTSTGAVLHYFCSLNNNNTPNSNPNFSASGSRI